MHWKEAAKNIAQNKADKLAKEANSRARTRSQKDMNLEGIEYIAKKTNHPNLAQACFFEYDISDANMHIEINADGSVLDGFFHSRSKYHKTAGNWVSVTENYSISRSDFWAGHRAPIGNYGDVDGDWVVENFWNGRKYVTNAWPLNPRAKFLSVQEEKDVNAQNIAQEYLNSYVASGRYSAYVREEFNALL